MFFISLSGKKKNVCKTFVIKTSNKKKLQKNEQKCKKIFLVSTVWVRSKFANICYTDGNGCCYWKV